MPDSELKLYDELTVLQKGSSELVIWSNLVMQMVTIAYPMSRGKPIEPNGVRDWLNRRDLFWACFCCATAPAGEACSTRIVESMGKEVFVFCAAYPSKCGFFINLTKVHARAKLRSEYPLMPINGIPDLEMLRSKFWNRESSTQERNPYFEHYCGEHQSKYPGIKQASGAHLTISKAPIPVLSRGPFYNTESVSAPLPRKRRVSPFSTAGPSKFQKKVVAVSEREGELLEKLGRGEGMTDWEQTAFFERCGGCGLLFVSSALRGHIKSSRCGGE